VASSHSPWEILPSSTGVLPRKGVQFARELAGQSVAQRGQQKQEMPGRQGAEECREGVAGAWADPVLTKCAELIYRLPRGDVDEESPICLSCSLALAAASLLEYFRTTS